MINKLRWKFIVYAELSIFALLAIILISINAVNFAMVASDADQITLKIAQNGGSFGRKEDRPFQGNPGEEMDSGDFQFDDQDRPFKDIGPGPDNPEMRDSVRFFTIIIDENGMASMPPEFYRVNVVSEEEAIAWGKSLIGSEKGWSHVYYRYRCYSLSTEPNKIYIAVIDQSRELSPSYHVLNASIIGSVAGLSLSFLVLLFASKWFVSPLVASDKKQKRFISDASHELKTPLTIISANAELLELQHGENENITAIHHQVRRLTEIIRQLNDLARLEEEMLVSEKFDICTTADETIQTFSAAFENKNIDFQYELPEGELLVQKNESAVRALFSILLDNAAKYGLTQAKLKIYQQESRVIIRVSNDAHNIEDGPMDRVFERFYRSDDARGNGIEGSGIGLSIAKAIVTKLGGRIYAKGKDGEFIIKVEL